MKRKTIFFLSVIVLFVSLFATTVSVTAADGDTTTQPKHVKVGGVELEIKRFPLSRYQANNEESDSRIKGAFVGLTNVTFSFAGNIVRVVDTGMDILYNLQPIDRFADSITNVSKTIYHTLKRNFGETLFIFASGYVVYLFVVRGSIKEAMRRSILFICVLVIGGLWMSHAGYYMKALNSLSVQAQGKLLSAGNGFVGMVKEEGKYKDNSKIVKGKEMEGAVAILRNVYFDLALKKPYLIVNYNETNEKKINQKGSEEKGGVTRIDKLLSYKLSGEGEEERQKFVEDTEVEEYNNEAMAGGNVFTQLGESVIAVFAAIVLGVPFLGLAFFNFLLHIIALAIVFFLPFAFIISYVPQLAYSGFVTLGRLGSVFLLKAMLGIITLFVYVMCFIVDQLIPPNGFGMYLLNVVVLSAILWIGFKKRDAIIKFVTAGKVVSIDNNMIDNVRKEIVQPSWEAAKQGANSFGSGVSNMFSHFAKTFHNRSGNGSSNESVSRNMPAGSEGEMGDNTAHVSRTPQLESGDTPTRNGKTQVERKPQQLEEKEQSFLPQTNNGHSSGKKEVKRKEENPSVLDMVYKNGVYEIASSKDEEEKVKAENRTNAFERSEIQIERVKTDKNDTSSKKMPDLQERKGEVERTEQLISSNENKPVNQDSIKKIPETSIQHTQDVGEHFSMRRFH